MNLRYWEKTFKLLNIANNLTSMVVKLKKVASKLLTEEITYVGK